MCHATDSVLLVKLFFHYVSRISNHQNFIYTVYRKTHTATKNTIANKNGRPKLCYNAIVLNQAGKITGSTFESAPNFAL